MHGEERAKTKRQVKIKWSPEFAYAIGLLASDGCVLNDGLHIELTSKDEEQLINFLKALDIEVRLTEKHSSFGKKYQRVQFGDVLFHSFLVSVGITPAKSKTIGVLKIPKKYFFDFLRGSFDGDGSFYSYWDPRWRSSHMFYLTFSSASLRHIEWLRKEILGLCGAVGHISKSKDKRSVFNLRFAKTEALVIIKKMYYNQSAICLSRKKTKIQTVLMVESRQQGKYH